MTVFEVGRVDVLDRHKCTGGLVMEGFIQILITTNAEQFLLSLLFIPVYCNG
jgi:hypothetical protein